MIRVIEIGYGIAKGENGNLYYAEQRNNETHFTGENKKEYKIVSYNDNDEVEEIEEIR